MPPFLSRSCLLPLSLSLSHTLTWSALLALVLLAATPQPVAAMSPPALDARNPPLASSAGTAAALSPVDVLEIHQVLHTYCRAVDSKNFALLDQVFLPNAVANYSAPVNLLNGTAEIESVVGQGLQYVTSQHMMGTWVWYPGETAAVPVVDASHTPVGNCGVPNVKSEIYFQASMFGTGKYYGQAVFAHGYYVDNLVKIARNGTACAWRIATRQLVHQGPEFGNDTIFQSS